MFRYEISKRLRRDVRVHLDELHLPHGGVRPFHQKSTCITQLTLGPCVVQNWSRNTPKSSPNETHEAHRVGFGFRVSGFGLRVSGFGCWGFTRTSCGTEARVGGAGTASPSAGPLFFSDRQNSPTGAVVPRRAKREEKMVAIVMAPTFRV